MSIDVSEVRAASIIALTMEAACTSETSVNIQLRTQQYISEDSELHDSNSSVKTVFTYSAGNPDLIPS
jgi:hypothetical protein